MTFRTSLIPLILCGVLLAACAGQPSTPVITIPTAAPTTEKVVTLAPAATAALTATATQVPPTETAPAASATAVPEATKSTTPLITAQNAASLSEQTLKLADYPLQLLWPGPDAKLPKGLQSMPDLFALADGKLIPITLDPLRAGDPIALPVPGDPIAFAPGLTSVLSRLGDAAPSVYDFSGKLLYTLDVTSAYGAAYSADGKWLAVTTPNELSIILYDAATGKRKARLTGFQTAAPVYGGGVFPGGQTVYWISRATFALQDVASAKIDPTYRFMDFITSWEIAPDGKSLALSVESKLLLYPTGAGEPSAQVTLSQPLGALSFSPDGALLAGGYGATLQIWDAATLSPLASLPGPNTSTAQVHFSPDGRVIAAMHDDNLLGVWRVK